jgi:hypothetical protein
VPGSNGTILFLTAPYVLFKDEKLVFLGIIQDLKTPTNYVGQLAKRVTLDRELKELKFHDYHMLMQQLLPLCVRTLLANVRMAIIKTCHVFGRICAKSVDPSTIPELLEEIAPTMCLLEKVFPSSFFDVMMHLPIHLVLQLDICGPVHIRWMYPMERYRKTRKVIFGSEHSQKVPWHKAI